MTLSETSPERRPLTWMTSLGGVYAYSVSSQLGSWRGSGDLVGPRECCEDRPCCSGSPAFRQNLRILCRGEEQFMITRSHHPNLLPPCYQDRTTYPHLPPHRKRPQLWFLVGLGCLRLAFGNS